MIVVSDKELPEPGVEFGVFGQPVLVASVKVSLEVEFDWTGIGNGSIQGFYFHDMRQSLPGNGDEYRHDTNKLDDMLSFRIHQNLK